MELKLSVANWVQPTFRLKPPVIPLHPGKFIAANIATIGFGIKTHKDLVNFISDRLYLTTTVGEDFLLGKFSIQEKHIGLIDSILGKTGLEWLDMQIKYDDFCLRSSIASEKNLKMLQDYVDTCKKYGLSLDYSTPVYKGLGQRMVDNARRIQLGDNGKALLPKEKPQHIIQGTIIDLTADKPELPTVIKFSKSNDPGHLTHIRKDQFNPDAPDTIFLCTTDEKEPDKSGVALKVTNRKTVEQLIAALQMTIDLKWVR
jgi:hypothetical protein